MSLVGRELTATNGGFLAIQMTMFVMSRTPYSYHFMFQPSVIDLTIVLFRSAHISRSVPR